MSRKEKKEPKKSSAKSGSKLSRILMIRVLSLVIGIALLISISSCVISYNTAIDNMHAQVDATAVAYNEVLEKAVDEYKLAVQAMARDSRITNMNYSLEQRKEFLQELADQFGFIDASVSDAEGYTYNDTYVAEREYFIRAMAGEAYLSTTMVRKTDGSTVMFASAPVNNNTGYKGVVYAAVDYTGFYNQVENMAIGESGIGIAIDKEGKLMIYPDATFVTNFVNFADLAVEDPSYEGFAQLAGDMLANEEGSGIYDIYGEDYYACFKNIAGSDGWCFAAATSKKEMLHDFNVALLINLIIFAIMVLLSVVITDNLKNSIAKPLNAITDRLMKLADGDGRSPVPEISGCQEITNLRESTVAIVNSVESLINETDKIASETLAGNLDVRGDRSRFDGAYSKLLKNINSILDAVVPPLRKASDYMHSIGVGDVPEKLDVAQFNGEFAEIASSINFCIDAVDALIYDTGYIAEAAVAGDFSRRGDLAKHEGDFRKIIEGVNKTLDVVVDKAGWYQAILDSVPFPIQVTDNDMNWTFMNVSCSNVLREAGVCGEHRAECYGKTCIDEKSPLCSNANSGIKKFKEESVTESTFTLGNKQMKQQTSWLTNRKQEKLGVVEIAMDQTEVMTALENAEKLAKTAKMVGDYQSRAVAKVVSNLEKVAVGNLNLDTSIEPATAETAEVAENFSKINRNLEKSAAAIRALVEDANRMAEHALAGEVDERADESKHGGEYANVVKGINATMDAIITPVRESLVVIGAMSEGDLTQRMTGEYNGNYNLIKDGVNTTCDNMQRYVSEIARVLQGIGEGNLDQAVTAEYKGDFVQIKDSLNEILDSLNSIMGQINQLADGVTSGSKQVSEGSQNLSDGSTRQAGSVQQLSLTMNRVAEQIQQNTEDARKASNLSSDVMNRARQGNEQMKNMLISMDDINESSANISKIIKVIDDIAFQTNILALNAAVEAARAGVHGKGFAVVADEVRSLAAKSAEAASETTALIEGSISKVAAGTKIANETASALEEIVNGITETSSLCNAIADISEEQTAGIMEVNNGIEEVSRVVQTNSATAEESAASSAELYSQAQEMKNMVSTFKLK